MNNQFQGLDMATVASMGNSSLGSGGGGNMMGGGNSNRNDDVVCTPDFPIEPLCEVRQLDFLKI